MVGRTRELLFLVRQGGFLVVRFNDSILQHHRDAYQRRDANQSDQERPEKQARVPHNVLTNEVHCNPVKQHRGTEQKQGGRQLSQTLRRSRTRLSAKHLSIG